MLSFCLFFMGKAERTGLLSERKNKPKARAFERDQNRRGGARSSHAPGDRNWVSFVHNLKGSGCGTAFFNRYNFINTRGIRMKICVQMRNGARNTKMKKLKIRFSGRFSVPKSRVPP